MGTRSRQTRGLCKLSSMLYGKAQRIIPSKALPAGASFYSIDYVGWIAIYICTETLHVLAYLAFPVFPHHLDISYQRDVHKYYVRCFTPFLTPPPCVCVILGRFILTPPPPLDQQQNHGRLGSYLHSLVCR